METERPADTTTQRRRAETRARLQRALLERVDGSSFRDLRVEDIAATAGLSRSAFYFYYAGKHALLIDAASELGEAIFAQADRWWHGDGPPREQIREALSGVAELWAQYPELLRTTVEVATYDPAVRTFWRELVGRFITATAEHIAREQEAGAIDRALDPQGSAEILIWGAERNLYILITSAGREPAEIVAPTTELWLRALYG